MPTRQTPVTYIGTSLANTNSTIAGISTGYANTFSTSNLTVATSLLMSNATPSIKQAEFYSTSLAVFRGNIIQSNTVYNDGTVSTAPDGAFSLQNTYITGCNAGISIVNQPYDPGVDANAYSSNLNSFFLNTNVVIANADSVGVPASGLQYGGIGFGCNSPSFPIDMYIDPSNNPGTVYHGAAISLNDGGIRINSDQLAQINVTTTGTVAESVFNTSGAGGPIMAYGSGSASRGGYIFATAGDAINIAATGQVSICNAGVAQTNYSLYVGGNTAINGSTIITNGTFRLANSTVGRAIMNSTILSLSTSQFDLSNTTVNMQEGSFTQSNSELQYHDLYSTSLRVFNGPLLQSNLAQQTARFFCTNMSIYTGDFLISSTSGNLRSATLNGTNFIVNSGNTTLRSTFTMSNSAGRIAANLFSTNLSLYGGNFVHSNAASITATANFYSTNVGILGGNLLLSNSGSVTATAALYSTNMTIYNGNLTLQPNTGRTATFYSTGLDLYGDLTVYGTVNNRGDTTTYIADRSATATGYVNAATVNFSNFSGLVIVNNTATTGGIVMWLCGGGSTAALGSSGISSGTGIITANAGIFGYTWSNNSGGSLSTTFTLIRTRAQG